MPAPPSWDAEGHQLAGRGPLAAVAALEAISAGSWPPLETADLDGWVLRAANGVTRRANSAWPRSAGELGVTGRLDAVGDWYARRGLPACVQLSPTAQPPGLHHTLTDLGWAVSGATDVMTGALPLIGLPIPAGVSVRDEPDDDWLAVAGAVAAGHFGADRAATGLALLHAIATPCAYAVTRDHDGSVGCGRAVRHEGWLGLFTMGTLPAARRRGHAGRVLAALADWGRLQGATRGWLQVEESNRAAVTLYRRAGFTTVYSYAYARPQT